MATKKKITTALVISPAKLSVVEFHITGNAPLVLHKFSHKAQEIMLAKQMESNARSKKADRAPRDLDADFQGSLHVATDGTYGIPCSAFRSALISACRLAGYQMTKAKLSVFVVADCMESDGTQLVRITKGEPQKHTTYARLATGVPDIRTRPMWKPGWEAILTVRFDEDQLSHMDVGNLIMRAGLQVGIGEGRPDSKSSAGAGWGTFVFARQDEEEDEAA